MSDLDAPPATDGRIRRPGAGRKSLRERDPELEAALDALIDPDVRGDPESPLRWTCKSTGQLALALTRGGHQVSASTVGVMKRDHGVYPTNVQISDANMAAVGLLPHDFHGDSNYTLYPHP